MPFLVINGVEFPVAVDSFTEVPREVGQTVNAFDGSPIRSRQSTKRDLEFSSRPLDAESGIAWEKFIRGEGEWFSFSTLYGSKGTPPGAGYSGTLDSGNGVVGGNALLLTSGTHTYAMSPSSSSWTVALWHSTSATPGTGYSHYVVTSDATKWVNGARNDAASTTFVSVSSGVVTLTGASNTRFDKLMVLPFVVPTSWGSEFYDELVTARSYVEMFIPELMVYGDGVSEGFFRQMLGEVSSTEVIRGASSGGLAYLRRLTVRLSEV